MSQQINLLNPALISKRQWLTPNTLFTAFGLFVGGLVGLFVYESNALTLLEKEKLALTNQMATATQTLEQLKITINSQSKKTLLLEKITQLKEKQTMQQSILALAGQNNAGAGQSYAALLRAFSKQSVDGLWITGLNIDQDAQNLSISGRTLKADLVPEFIAKLRAEPALRGKTFTDLTMQVMQAKKVETTIAKQISSAVTDNNSQVTIDQPATQQMVASKPDYIEFTLRSVPEEADAQVAQDNQQLAGVAH